jgi:hypothetical protein
VGEKTKRQRVGSSSNYTLKIVDSNISSSSIEDTYYQFRVGPRLSQDLVGGKLVSSRTVDNSRGSHPAFRRFKDSNFKAPALRAWD